jgi:hypothetical protein
MDACNCSWEPQKIQKKKPLISLFCYEFFALDAQKNQTKQADTAILAYHGKIGRETTAYRAAPNHRSPP